jgi:hypothetical protein
MIRMRFPRSQWETKTNSFFIVWPRVTSRRSSNEWSGSGYVIASGSKNTDEASSKVTPCFLKFAAAFRTSHSNVTPPKFNAPVLARAQAKRRAAPLSPNPRPIRTGPPKRPSGKWHPSKDHAPTFRGGTALGQGTPARVGPPSAISPRPHQHALGVGGANHFTAFCRNLILTPMADQGVRPTLLHLPNLGPLPLFGQDCGPTAGLWPYLPHSYRTTPLAAIVHNTPAAHAENYDSRQRQ